MYSKVSGVKYDEKQNIHIASTQLPTRNLILTKGKNNNFMAEKLCLTIKEFNIIKNDTYQHHFAL